MPAEGVTLSGVRTDRTESGGGSGESRPVRVPKVQGRRRISQAKGQSAVKRTADIIYQRETVPHPYGFPLIMNRNP